MIKKKIGIVGLGMVGGALRKWFEKQDYELFLYDKYKKIGFPELLKKADYIYICVPTPTIDQRCDIDALIDVLNGLKGEKVVIIKSTILPGTTASLQIKYPQHKILFNPEFLTAKNADQDMHYPDRQIIGTTVKSHTVATDILQQLPLAPFETIVPSGIAEMAKYFNNCWLASKVTFANQMYDVCEKLGINYDTVADIVMADKRIGRTHWKIWNEGYRGYDGMCLPKDTKAFLKFAKDLKVDLPTLIAADKYNDKLRGKNSKRN